MLHSSTDLVIVLWVGAVAITIQQSIKSPYFRFTAMAGTDPPQQLLQLGTVSYCMITMAVRQIFNNGSY